MIHNHYGNEHENGYRAEIYPEEETVPIERSGPIAH